MVSSWRNGNLLQLFLAHRRQLVRYADTIIGDHGLAEDIVQDAYLRLDQRAASRAKEPPSIREPVAYLYQVVRNLAIDAQRRSSRERTLVGPGSAHPAEETASDGLCPEATIMARDDIRALEKALSELPERTRRALHLHRFCGFKLAEIAAELDISVGTAHSLVVDALEHCRQRLARQPARSGNHRRNQ